MHSEGRKLGIGVLVLFAVLLGFLLAPALPGEDRFTHVASKPTDFVPRCDGASEFR